MGWWQRTFQSISGLIPELPGITAVIALLFIINYFFNAKLIAFVIKLLLFGGGGGGGIIVVPRSVARLFSISRYGRPKNSGA